MDPAMAPSSPVSTMRAMPTLAPDMTPQGGGGNIPTGTPGLAVYPTKKGQGFKRGGMVRPRNTRRGR